jgi:hypothetical protein
MQTSKLQANNFTKAFEDYKNIYKRHLQKWSAMLKCKWVQGTKIKSWEKKTKLNKTKNIKTKQQNNWIKKVLKKPTSFFNLAHGKRGGEYNTQQVATITQGKE